MRKSLLRKFEWDLLEVYSLSIIIQKLFYKDSWIIFKLKNKILLTKIFICCLKIFRKSLLNKFIYSLIEHSEFSLMLINILLQDFCVIFYFKIKINLKKFYFLYKNFLKRFVKIIYIGFYITLFTLYNNKKIILFGLMNHF